MLKYKMPKKPHHEKIITQHYMSSPEGKKLAFSDYSQPLNPVIKEDTRLFSYARYSEEVHPLIPTNIYLEQTSNNDFVRCLDMPIRLAGQEEYCLPNEWLGLEGVIQQVIDLEHAHNLNWQEYNTYITVDNSLMEVNSQQRRGGLHVDGFQGERISPKTKITRNYIVSNNGGTRFYDQRFIVVDPKRYNVFHGFDMQTQGWGGEDHKVAEEGQIYFMNAYSVHESGFANRPGQRLFLRVTYDIKKFDRLGNTHNSMLDYEWEMFDRDTQETVESPDISHVEASPYIFTAQAKFQSLEKPLLVGISGKPGSGKNWISLKIIQELNFHGIKAEKTSLATQVYKQLNCMVDDILIENVKQKEFLQKYQIMNDELVKQFYKTLIEGDIGEKHVEYGYHRRNKTVRNLLSLLSQIRREENINYWLDKMLEQVSENSISAAVFSDLRFENEAEYLLDNKGFLIRAELDPIWLKETQGRNPGFKYSDEYLNSPMESGLDNYKKFDLHTSAQTFKVEQEIQNIIDISTAR